MSITRYPLAGELVDAATPVSVMAFGAAGDGTTDDTAALAVAVAAGVPLRWPRGDYKISTMLAPGVSGRAWIGEPGARLFSDTLTHLVNIGGVSNFRIEGMTFESTLSNATEDVFGLLRSLGTMSKVIIRGCTFKAALRATNGIKIVADGLAANAVDDILIEDCVFDTIGRMGVELQNHTYDGVTRIRNVRVTGCTFRSCGALSQGIALSFSGRTLGSAAVNNTVSDSATIAIEFAINHQYPRCSGNTFYALGTGCYPVSFTNGVNTEYVPGALIESNVSADRSGAGYRLNFMDGARLRNNIIRTVGVPMDVRRSRRIRASGEDYDTSAGTYALYVESTVAPAAEDNRWVESDFTNATGGFSVVRFLGSGAVRNKIVRSRLSKTAGVFADQSTSAVNNELVECTQGTTPWAAAQSVALTDADTTLTLLNVDAAVLTFTGTLTAVRAVTFPRGYRSWTVKNSTAYALTFGAGSGTVSLPPATTATYTVTDQTSTLTGLRGQREVREYAATSTGVSVPAGVLGCYVTLIGGGNGGGSGRRGAAATARVGGGGGASGGATYEQWVATAALGGTYDVTVGAGGAGGAAVATDDTSGAAGVSGGFSRFTSGGVALVSTATGAGGAGGASGSAGAGGGPGNPNSIAGASASATGAAGGNGSTYTNLAPGSGGAGGGVTAADAASAGGTGGAPSFVGLTTGTAGGVVGGATPVVPTDQANGRPGQGGGGGAGSISGAAQAGAVGATPGGGGGGGGASLNGNASGAGGAGGNGYVRVTFVYA